ncbi:Imm1 family immunity protein [Kitasatospora indigofera]|uniref:Imm1 family immunity protein n=1 Tax=Kitasatospora indigofera TaxID=67307 RepID=UPI003696F8AE
MVRQPDGAGVLTIGEPLHDTRAREAGHDSPGDVRPGGQLPVQLGRDRPPGLQVHSRGQPSGNRGRGAEGVYSPGHEAWFIVRETQGSKLGGYLRVAADEQSGYGALTWWMRGRTSGIYDSFWISDNPGPPYTGPELVADPYSGECHEPASSLPLPRIRAAIEEFCRSRTGERPTCINWVTGSYNGERDAPSR